MKSRTLKGATAMTLLTALQTLVCPAASKLYGDTINRPQELP